MILVSDFVGFSCIIHNLLPHPTVEFSSRPEKIIHESGPASMFFWPTGVTAWNRMGPKALAKNQRTKGANS